MPVSGAMESLDAAASREGVTTSASSSDSHLEEAARSILHPQGSRYPVRRLVQKLAVREGQLRTDLYVDVDVPDLGSQAMVPLFDRSKLRPVRELAARDEAGLVLPLATRRESGAVALIALRLALAEAGEPVSLEEDRLLARLVLGRVDEAYEVLQILGVQRPRWLDHETVRDLCFRFAENAVLGVLVPCDGRRRTVRVTWTEYPERQTRWPASMWRRTFQYPLVDPRASAAESYHYSIAVPPGYRVETVGPGPTHPVDDTSRQTVFPAQTAVVVRRARTWLSAGFLVLAACALLAALLFESLPASTLAVALATVTGYAVGVTRLVVDRYRRGDPMSSSRQSLEAPLGPEDAA